MSRKIKIACVHGINTNEAEAALFASNVDSVFRSTDLEDYVSCIPITWSSSDLITGDLYRFIASKKIFSWVLDVRSQVGHTQPDLIVAHSMGVPLSVVANCGVPIIAIGSPIGHSWYHHFLTIRYRHNMNVLNLPWAIDLWNRDDPVACSQLWPINRVKDMSVLGWQETRVAYPGSMSFKEHSHEIYLASPVVRDIIKSRVRNLKQETEHA
jgi:hypothetical protein